MSVDFGGWRKGFSAFAAAQKHHPFADRRRAGTGGHTLAVEIDAGGLIAAEDLAKGQAEFAFKIEHLPVVRAKLFFERYPRDKSGFPGIDSV